VDAVGKSHRLNGLVSDPGVFGRKIIGDRARHSGARQQRANDDIARQPVGPFWKNVRHLSLLFCVLNGSEHKTPAIVLAATNLVNLFSRTAATNSSTNEPGYTISKAIRGRFFKPFCHKWQATL
jgi:hypothetical protein